MNKTHGMTSSGTYKCWRNMRARCNNEKTRGWDDYGGRGISVCDRWRVFTNFLGDMGARPEGLTLDRIDVNGDYEPANCRWATLEEQRNNRRDNHRITARGKSRTIAQWEQELGMSEGTISHRIRRGWTAEMAIEAPVEQRRRVYGHV